MDSTMHTCGWKSSIYSILLMFGAVGALSAAPCQNGPTGGLTIPDPMTLEPGKVEAGVTFESFDQLTTDQNVATSVDFNAKVNAGVYHNLEVGLDKTYRQKSSLRDEPFYAQIKMRFPIDTFNVAVGLMGPISGPDSTVAYTVAGWKSLWGGFGVNFGGKQFKQLNSTILINAGVSPFGGFTLQNNPNANVNGTILNGTTVTGNADTFFGLLGFNYRVSRNMAILGDYDGDRFAGGFRFNVKELVVDAAYVGQKETDTLFSRNTQNVMVSVSHKF